MYKCDPWYSNTSTECAESYYNEDFYWKVPQPTKLRCFKEAKMTKNLKV